MNTKEKRIIWTTAIVIVVIASFNLLFFYKNRDFLPASQLTHMIVRDGILLVWFVAIWWYWMRKKK